MGNSTLLRSNVGVGITKHCQPDLNDGSIAKHFAAFTLAIG
jgi:hypothetical protein